MQGLRWHGSILACAVLLAVPLRAEVKLGGAFGDGMVLQRDAPVHVWGRGAPGEKVRVSIAGHSASAVAGDDGSWSVDLEPQKAGGPHEMVVTATNELHLRDVWFGDVWLCSGQSNMQFPLAAVPDGKNEIPNLQRLELRLFEVPPTATEKPAETVEGHWVVCSEANAGTLSAVGYYFAKDLRRNLKVPIGLIQAVVGGSVAEAWTDLAALKADEKLAPSLKRAARNPLSRPGWLFNGMVAPIGHTALKGVLWYQGESNVGFAEQYRILFPTMIRSWRRVLGRDDLPFLYVQLPGCGPIGGHESGPQTEANGAPAPFRWADLRAAQAEALSEPATAMAVTIDVGDVDLHPPLKAPVGERLARLARSEVYGDKKVVAHGPTFAGMKIEGDTAKVRFDHAEGGLRAHEGDKLLGFEMAGEDHRFAPAEARIDSGRVLVRSPAVSKPVAVRYAWGDHPLCNLANGEGLPAAPFRAEAER